MALIATIAWGEIESDTYGSGIENRAVRSAAAGTKRPK
jgi:hypothetical protein